MGINIYVLSKVEFDGLLQRNNIDDMNVDEFITVAFISINDSSGDYYKNPLFRINHHNVLNLWFDDVEKDGQLSPTNKEETKAFSSSQANTVIEFLNSNKSAKTLFVHCAAGISRSGAVGQFALDYLKGNKESFVTNNKHILPNGRVLRLLNEALRNR